MIRFLSGAALCAVAAAAALSAAAERSTVYVLDRADAVTVDEDDLVRIPVSVQAGGDVSAEVDGPAKLTEYRLGVVRADRRPVGASSFEFYVRPTGPGAVRVTVRKTHPSLSTDPAKTYRVEVRKD